MYTTSVSSKTYGLNSTSELQTALHIKLQAVKNRGEKKTRQTVTLWTFPPWAIPCSVLRQYSAAGSTPSQTGGILTGMRQIIPLQLIDRSPIHSRSSWVYQNPWWNHLKFAARFSKFTGEYSAGNSMDYSEGIYNRIPRQNSPQRRNSPQWNSKILP